MSVGVFGFDDVVVFGSFGVAALSRFLYRVDRGCIG